MTNQNEMGFDLLRMAIKGFLLYKREAVIEFGETTAIVGPTGSGKTTWVDALTYALYKRNSRDGTVMSDILDAGGYILVEFSKEAHHYMVKRGRNMNGTSYLHLTVDGERYKGNITASDVELGRIIGIDFKAFTASCIVRQREMSLFTQLGGPERIGLLQHLFRLEIFNSALKETKKQKKEITLKIEQLKGRMEAIKELIVKESSIRQEILDKGSEIGTLAAKRIEMKSNQEEIKSEIDKLRKEREQSMALEARKDEIGKKMDQLKTEISDLTMNIKSLDVEVQKMEIEKPSRENIERMKAKLKEIEDLDKELFGIEETIKARTLFENEQRKRYDEILDKYSGGITIDQFTEEIFEIASSKRLFREVEGEINKKKEECIKWAFSLIFKQEISTGTMIGQIENKLKIMELKIAKKRKEIGGKTDDDVKLEEDRLNSIEQSILRSKDSIEEKKRRDESLGRSLIETEMSIRQINGSMEGKENIGKSLPLKEAALAIMEEDISVLDSKIGQSNGILETLQKNLVEIEDYKKTGTSNDEKIAKMNEDYQLFDKIENEVFHGGAITMFATQSIIDVISIRASQLLEEMSAGQWTRIQFLPYKESNKYGFKIMVDGRDAKTFSGGEMTQINASIRFAVSERIAELANNKARIRTVFIDEGDLGSLDSEVARDNFIEVLISLKRYFKIILITHMQELVQDFDKVVRIEKRSGFSTVVS